MTKTSNEAFYFDSDGSKQDRLIHEDILDNPSADSRALVQHSIDVLRKQGFTEGQLAHLFDLEPKQSR